VLANTDQGVGVVVVIHHSAGLDRYRPPHGGIRGSSASVRTTEARIAIRIRLRVVTEAVEPALQLPVAGPLKVIKKHVDDELAWIVRTATNAQRPRCSR
jgi:hypothetical protein